MTTSEHPQATTGTITGVDLFAFFTADPERSVAFYRDVLGMVPTAVDEQGRGAEFTFADGTTFGVWQPDAPSNGAAVMLAVNDIHAAVTELRARGAQLSDPQDTPVCHMAFCLDPDGNSVIIHQRKT